MTADPPDPNATDVATYEQQVAAGRPIELRRLVVVEGPDKGLSFDLDANAPTRTLVGTSAACQILLTDRSVSRRHAAFEATTRGTYRLTDLSSTNGTFVEGVPIVEVFVRGGETARFGSTVVRLEAGVVPEQTPLPSAMRFGKTLGASVAMRRLFPLCEKLAKARVPLVIEGETGTGKEVLAESLHEMSGSRGPFVVFDCTTVSSNLIEAELFGHERGAFTGAERARAGVFEEADGGTLLIDEIGDMELGLQAKLLRALDRGEIRRVGSQKQINVNVRVLAATRRDLDKEVAAGRFRDDLFHRLAVARIELPPLRERYGDVPLLIRQFVLEMGGDAQLAQALTTRYADYSWPGNVRELRNLVARHVALGLDAGDEPGLELLVAREPPSATGTEWIESLVAQGAPFPVARRLALSEFERRYVAAVLAKHNGNVSAAAKASGLALRYFRLVKSRQK
ncbi:MAG: sigma 54-interacting transcriptional regulator [Myxococcales bacterium]|nr:sigma 54-interacting transcriptional regulator [Myxococcales bacterium]